MSNSGEHRDTDIVRFLKLQVIYVIIYNSVRMVEMKTLHQTYSFDKKGFKNIMPANYFSRRSLPVFCERDVIVRLIIG